MFFFVLSRYEISLLTKRLIDLVEELLLEGFILDELSDTGQTLRNLVGWQSAHQVEDGVSHHSLLVLSC